jgi:hypothetical protein
MVFKCTQPLVPIQRRIKLFSLPKHWRLKFLYEMNYFYRLLFLKERSYQLTNLDVNRLELQICFERR